TEMPRSCSSFMKSERVRRASPLARTWPASWMAPPQSRNFSVSVVLPASGWEMIAKVRRRAMSGGSGGMLAVRSSMGSGYTGARGRWDDPAAPRGYRGLSRRQRGGEAGPFGLVAGEAEAEPGRGPGEDAG